MTAAHALKAKLSLPLRVNIDGTATLIVSSGQHYFDPPPSCWNLVYQALHSIDLVGSWDRPKKNSGGRRYEEQVPIFTLGTTYDTSEGYIYTE